MRNSRLALSVLLLLVALSEIRAADPKQVLLLFQGPDGHAATTHEYARGVERLVRLLGTDERLQVCAVNADEPWTDGPQQLAGADGAVLFLAEGARWIQADPRRLEAFNRLAARGAGLTALHWAIGTKAAEPIDGYLKLLGGCHGGPDRKYQVVQTQLHIVDPAHAITQGMRDFEARDEFYYRLKFAPATDRIKPILQATIDGQAETVAWTFERPDGGRSFGFSGLHFDDNWELPEYRQLITSAIRWTLKLTKP